MADMISADEAKKLLGCDDATLTNYVNNGTLRAQRQGGALVLNKADVQNLASQKKSDSDEGTIVLSGDSEDLSIDLGEVVDSEAQTIVQTKSGEESKADQPITFGDELEVVNFDDSQTQDLTFQETGATENLSFTDQNTAVITDVDQTAVGGSTTGFQTVDYEEDAGAAKAGGPSGRRSVRSQRVRTGPVKVHWAWPVTAILTTVVIVALAFPYPILAMWPYVEDEIAIGRNEMASTYLYRGAKDNAWTDFAGNMVGFTIEPDEAAWRKTHAEGEYKALKNVDQLQPYEWRYIQYLGNFWTSPADENDETKWKDLILKRERSFTITAVEETVNETNKHAPATPIKAIAKDADGSVLGTYNVKESSEAGAEGQTGAKIYQVQVPLAAP